MSEPFRLLPGGRENEHAPKEISASRMLFLARSVNSSILQDALDAWGDIWNQFGDVTTGLLVEDSAAEAFKPKCGWPEFLEKMWLLRHYLDHAKRLSEGKA